MSHELSLKQPKHTLMVSERNEQTRVIAALMGALVEETIKELGSGQVGPAAGASRAQLRKEFIDAIAVLTAYVRQMERLISGGECDTPAQRGRRRAALLFRCCAPGSMARTRNWLPRCRSLSRVSLGFHRELLVRTAPRRCIFLNSRRWNMGRSFPSLLEQGVSRRLEPIA
jgi:hypothetical protein